MPAANRIASVLAIAAFVILSASSAGAEDLKPICADRPGKGTTACTLEKGHWQTEIGLWDMNFEHRGGVTTNVTAIGNSTIKFGVSGDADLEASMAAYQSVSVHGTAGRRTVGGVGDLFLRAKWNPDGDADGKFAWLLSPYVKLPTANRELGNGEVEAGLLVPMSLDLGGGWTVQSTPESDAFLNASGVGYHANLVDVLGLCYDLGSGFNLGTEIWTDQNFDPIMTKSQYSLDAALAWEPDLNDQLDGGLAVGLNRMTPDLELYVGFSRRF